MWTDVSLRCFGLFSIFLLLRYKLSFSHKPFYNRHKETISRAQKSNVTGTPTLLTCHNWHAAILQTISVNAHVIPVIRCEWINTNSPTEHTDSKVQMDLQMFELLIELLSKLFFISGKKEKLSADGRHRERTEELRGQRLTPGSVFCSWRAFWALMADSRAQ